ncbi:hypothetical protein DKP84_05335 [Acinetobacter pittii]|nr:hypothetical protein DKP84_05335 [Acinetobacter pittii]
MVEVELKFQLPESKKKTVQQYLKKHKAKNIHLQAKYYDTPDRLLAKMVWPYVYVKKMINGYKHLKPQVKAISTVLKKKLI